MDISIVVATHERPIPLSKMIESFRLYYPYIDIIAVDSSYANNEINHITHIHVAPDTWISKQRNIALKSVKTPYFLLVDDDFLCTEKTDIIGMINLLQQSSLWIVWWKVNNIWIDNYEFHGIYEIYDGILYHYVGIGNENNTYDVVFNFFVANSQIVKKLWGWDDNLKYAREHDDFFLQAKNCNVKIWYAPCHSIAHTNQIKHHSWIWSKQCVKYFLDKRWINEKIEIRHIARNNMHYISYHHCINPHTKVIIPQYIKEKIEVLYGIYPIVSS